MKVEFTDDIKVDFKIECAEMKVVNYRIYGKSKNKGYELITTKLEKQKAIDYAHNLSRDKYQTTLVIEHNETDNIDFPIDLEVR